MCWHFPMNDTLLLLIKIPTIIPVGTAVFCFGSILVGILARGIYLRKNGILRIERSFVVGDTTVKCIDWAGSVSVFVDGNCVLASSRIVDIVLKKTVPLKSGIL